MQGGLRGSVPSKGWAGEESWQEEIPQKKLGKNTNGRITKPCSAADSDNQAFSSRPPKPEAEVSVNAASTSVSLNKRMSHSCMQPDQSHRSALMLTQSRESPRLCEHGSFPAFNWEMDKYAEI